MSFALTTRQFKARTKTQTRRLGWDFLEVGDVVMGCEKCQGLKPGEKLVRLGPFRITAKRRQQLDRITQKDVDAEGFPELTPAEFVEHFCHNMRTGPREIVNVFDFEYLDPPEGATDGSVA